MATGASARFPRDLTRRIVEITGPVDRKMIINALNSGADVFMADFEDATAPTWRNVVQGQVNLRDAVRRTIAYTDPADGKALHARRADVATLLVRPRGLHSPRRISRWTARPCRDACSTPGCISSTTRAS